MAYAALVSLEQTTYLLQNPDRYFISVYEKEKIISIREYVVVLLSFLEDFPARASRLEAKIRDAANETEAIIEDFMWKQNRLSWWSSIGLSRSEFLQQLRRKTEEIGSIVGEAMDERAVSDSTSAVSSSGVAVTSNNDVVIGLDGDLMAIKDRLCGESSKLQVIPIVGMGGIGKTTLARKAYDDSLIVDYFHIRAWITVSQDYSARKMLSILIDSMKLFIEEEVLGHEADEMLERVYKTLKGRRYLIVMDDVWSTKVWDDLRRTFPDDGNGSRIMLTTRLLDVAAYPDSHSPLHRMRFMDASRSWDLLQQKVVSFPSELEDIGREIAQRCVGLPLAVVLVAGVLSAVNKTRASWEEIAKNVNPAVGLEMEAVLSLSYTHLPHHLRSCLLFIGGFPEDRIILASRLIKLWVAEGFLKHRNRCSRKSLEGEAEEYLEDLVKRNLVIVNSRKSDGRIKSCSLHDIIRDLCINKAWEEKFLHVMDGDVAPQGLMNERRISLSGRDDIYNITISEEMFLHVMDGSVAPQGLMNKRRTSLSGRDDIYNIWGPTIRTILCFKLQNSSNWQAFWGRSRLLRVLDAVLRCNGDELPAQLFELFHLRYLALFGYPKIPSAISNLVNLQTLIMRPTARVNIKWRDMKSVCDFSLPLGIWRMQQLRHLHMYAPHMLPQPDGDGPNLPLENLQTLLPIENLVWNEKILQMIPNVKRLGLVYTCNQEYGLHHLQYLHQLEKLEVIGYQHFSWQGRNPNFPRTLKKLTLVGGGFPWEDMAIVGSLPNLQVLKLRDGACDGEAWETSDEEFCELRFLQIDTSSLRRWKTQSFPFPRLKCLVLRSCLDLRKIPEDIGDIPTLELIVVHNCRNSVVKSAMKIKEDQLSYGNDTLQVEVKQEHEILSRKTKKRQEHENRIIKGRELNELRPESYEDEIFLEGT